MKLRGFHRDKRINKTKILLTFITIFILTSCIVKNFDIKFTESEQNEHFNSRNKTLKLAKISGPIHIDDNWTDAKIAGICTGNGDYSDPYVIEDLIINGQNSSSCILIENSYDFFRIENCTLFNSSSIVASGGGIKLNYVMNGTIFNNNCSNNNGHGIYLTGSNNITLSGNKLNENYGGILLSLSTNNTIFNNSAFKNDQRGIYLTSSSNNNTILNNNFTYNNQDGISISYSYNNTIRGNNADNNEYGIWVWNSHSNTIIRNTLSNNDLIGLRLYKSNDTDVLGNTLSYHDFVALRLDRSNNTDVLGNVFISNSYKNIEELDSENNFFKWNVEYSITDPIIIDDNGGGDFTWDQCINTLAWINGLGTIKDPYIIKDLIIDGQNSSSCIEIRNSTVFFKVEGCTLSNSGSGSNNAGIKLNNVVNGQLIDNDCSNNDKFGIFLVLSHNNTLLGNTLDDNSDGLYLGLSTINTISGNSAFNNTWRGIYLSSSSNNNTIFNNSLSYNQEGMLVSDSHNNTIRRNYADYNENGIWIWESNNNTIIGNLLSYNDLIGLKLYRSNNTDVIGNTFIGNLYKNIYEFDCENNFFKWNYLDGNFSPFIIDNNGGGDLTWSEAIDLFIWCTGSGSYSDPYIIKNLIIDGQNSSSCIEIRDSAVFFKIEGCMLSNSGSEAGNAGIKLSYVINGKLTANNCSNNNGFGIMLEISHNNTLSGNTLNENSNGVYLGLSTNNTITGNSAFNNNLRGIYLSSSSNNNTIMNNTVTYNDNNGIDIYDSHDIKVIGNIADNNDWNGIFLWECNNTKVARNIANDNLFAGLYLWNSNNTEVMGNMFNGNFQSIYEVDGENNIFTWNVENGFTKSIIIDDSGNGDFTWSAGANKLAWIYGSGTSIDPYVIELITIDGLNLTSCLTIRNSNVYFKIKNCHLYNSGHNLNDGGIKLISTSNGELIHNNCSFNSANGIILDSCQFIIITENSINNNKLSGIVLIDSNNIDINNNNETISFNDLYGIYLSNSHYNNITRNTITHNHIGIFLDQSNYNFIDWNNLLHNDQAIVDNGIGNVFGPNNDLPVPTHFPFDILIIGLIIGITIFGVVGATVIIKKKLSISAKKGKEISEKKKEKTRKIIKEKITPFPKERETKLITPVIGKEEELKFNLFMSYSTLDKDHFQIEKIVNELKKYPRINHVSYWERDSKANIVEFMDKTLEVSNIFILFCSENSLKSIAVKDEWQAAFQMRKQGLIKLIPVYEQQEHIPKLLWHLLNVKYDQADFKGFVENLYKEIIR